MEPNTNNQEPEIQHPQPAPLPNQEPVQQQPYVQQPGQQPLPPNPYYPVPVPHPGRTISIIGFVCAFVGLGLPGLILSIIGMSQSKKAGKADIFSILGVIFNSLAIVFGLLYIGFIVMAGYWGFQSGTADIKQERYAADISSAAAAYKASNKDGAYPSSDPAAFISDLANTNGAISVDPAATKELSADHPSSSEPTIVHVAYCGGTDAAKATGFEVEYWSTASSSIHTATTGTGCTASPDQSSGIQNGSSSGTASQ